MNLDRPAVRQCLKAADFSRLFTQELGWDFPPANQSVTVAGAQYPLRAVAQKRGLVVYECPASNGAPIPDYQTRRRIDHKLTSITREHIIIFTDSAKKTQIWQWVKREPGRPVACREHTYRSSQTGEALFQKLSGLAVSLEDEEKFTLMDATTRMRAAFDVDRVTKRFYERFKTEHTAFLKFIKGIENVADREWYASLMLNRLMFIYFIQKKRFLDGDPHYLRSRMVKMRLLQGKDKFLSFYRHFLLRLFHEGLGAPGRDRELDELLGKVPFLNGGLFDIHKLEEDPHGKEIVIPDKAFEKLFDFFDAYHWHLDERPLRRDDEINPDVLGYIFEKYINQKQMGAYYTKEDITEYIAKSTIIPYLFDAAQKKCEIAFRPESALWRLLRDDPDRYIYAAMKHGVLDDNGNILPLPPAVAEGLDDVSKRGGWNGRASDEYGLPTETWREHVARRSRCLEVRGKLTAGEVHAINDLVTYNLDIRQFAQDAIESCEGPELLRAFYFTIAGRPPQREGQKPELGLSVLDPTCGSGAFLFAALNVLEPLYEACLDRMEGFVNGPPFASAEGESAKPKRESFADFRRIRAEVDDHANERYFILKRIVIGNLYGVDIMEEAVEICKLRLFLKLVAQLERIEEVEPLPDIDFNIRAGNTLVGYTSISTIRNSMIRDSRGNLRTMTREDEAVLEDIEVKAAAADEAFQRFRAIQSTRHVDAREAHSAKSDLSQRLETLRTTLDSHLAAEYGVDTQNPDALKRWRDSHQPFHWLTEFYGIMQSGGFDVIIGNPPWIEYAKVKGNYTVKNYQTERCGNLHALCTERGLRIRSPLGCMSFIVQLPMVSSSRMVEVRRVLKESSADLHVIPFGDRPGKLFEGLEHSRATIWLSRHSSNMNRENSQFATSRYQRWPTAFRPFLLETLEYARTNSIADIPLYPDQFPKYANILAVNVFHRMKQGGDHTIGELASQRETRAFVFYQEATEYWVKATVGLPYYAKNGRVGAPAHGRYLYHANEDEARWTCALMHSSLFFVYFVAHSDCFHLSDGLVRAFPVPKSAIGDKKLMKLGGALMDSLRTGAERKTIETRAGDEIAYDEYYGWKAKPIIDRIDALLAEHYGFADEELDFIVTYDAKFRMGREDHE